MGDPVTEVGRWLAAAGSVAVLTGAGTSTASGIPDFRGPQGLWTTSPESQRLSSIEAYVTDPEVRRRSWLGRRDHPAWTARPNKGHVALADLETSGRLSSLATQNIDGLHQLAGNQHVLELHGTIRNTVCLSCGDRRPMGDALARLAEDPDPPCLVCGGMLKSATVSFGQPLDARVLDAAALAASTCDIYLAIGTTLTVHPAAGLCELAVDSGARLVIVNDTETPYDDLASVRLDGRIEEVLPVLVAPSPVGRAH
ncbi:MAG TPA: Sir2 family NAD-dependent protein deacetylase [Mycobacteriales bacterium]